MKSSAKVPLSPWP